jgi:hypothetical protein
MMADISGLVTRSNIEQRVRMKRQLHDSSVLGLAVAVLWTMAPAQARAHGGMEEDRTPPAASSQASRPQADAEASAGEAGREGVGESRAVVALDLVLGWGHVPFALQNLPTTATQAITYTRSDATPSDVQSFILGGDFEATEHLGIGARIPFALGTFSPAGSAARSTTSLGNVEIEGAWGGVAPGARIKLALALGLAIPTAQGDEIPTTLAGSPASSVNPGSYDRFSLARAAALARGYEDNALFEPGRAGVVPKVSLSYEGSRVRIEPYVKVENLIRTNTSLEAPYVGEIVAAVGAAVRVGARFEVAVRGWVNIGFAGTPDDRSVAAAVEPDVIVTAGRLKGYAGVVVPLVGPPAQAAFLGARMGLAVAF